MATLSDITTIKLSGLNYIDALLNNGPSWNYQTPAGNVLYYTYSISSGTESGQVGQQAFSTSQQIATNKAFAYLSAITGIQFVETRNGDSAQIHLANIDIADPRALGLTDWQAHYTWNQQTGELGTYNADAWVYLDNADWVAETSNPAPGGIGYEILLHELGHALGLKHPFADAGDPPGTPVLPASLDNTANTLMSYTIAGGPRSTYSQYDIAALEWIYGGDGLRGALGTNSTTGGRYLAGTSGDDNLVGTAAGDVFVGYGGTDTIDGGAGYDVLLLRGARSDYTVTQLGDGTVRLSSAIDGTATAKAVELFSFTDSTYQFAQLVNPNLPPPPSVHVATNAGGYATGNTAKVSGVAAPNASITIYSGNTVVATAHADGHGQWGAATTPFADGKNYYVYATATDTAGATSAASASVEFSVDTTPPPVTVGAPVIAAGDNQPLFNGTGEASDTIRLIRTSDHVVLGQGVVNDLGTWSVGTMPLPNGDYTVSVQATDAAGNVSTAASQLSFHVEDSANLTGTGANDVFHPVGDGSAIVGGAGTDLVRYDGPRSSYTVVREGLGYAVLGHDAYHRVDRLVDVERIQFSDGSALALDVDGAAGQAYRLYQAAFDRVPDRGGLGFWIAHMDAGATLEQVALEFTHQPEFQSLYGTTPSDTDFVTHLYSNVLDRAPDGAGFDFWVNVLASHLVSREAVLVAFSESPENQAQVAFVADNGMPFIPWLG